MKWLKKWCYLLLFIGAGIVYLSRVDHWQVYAGALEQVEKWCSQFENGLLFAAGSDKAEDAWAKGSISVVDINVDADSGELSGGGMPGSKEESGFEDMTGSGTQGGNLGDMTGSGNLGGSLGGVTGSGNGGNAPGGVTGSGNGGNASGGVTGSGNSGNAPGGMTGSGNGGNAPGGVTGSGNHGSSPGGVTGSGNSGNAPGGMTGSGNSGNVSGGMTGSGNHGSSPGGVTGSGNTGGVSGGSGLPEVQYAAVEDDYFADAVFIGDSRTVGMFEYGGLEEISTFYASTGLTVYKLFDSEIVTVPGERKKITVEEALQQNSFAKIYLMIGINEMGTGTVESFLEKYQEVVDHLQELQPDAIIYLQAIIKVTAKRSAQGDYINNEGIITRNEGIAQMADNEKIFFLDVNPEICDESGGMVPDYTFDGVHLKAKYIEIWKDYLKSHAISS